MAHFAKLDDNNVVIEVHVVHNNDAPTEEAGISFLTNWSGGYTNWKQCSYNGTIRKQYPGIGYYYDSVNDIYIAPQPYPSWSLDNNFDWQSPVPRPDGFGWVWNEELLNWIQEN